MPIAGNAHRKRANQPNKRIGNNANSHIAIISQGRPSVLIQIYSHIFDYMIDKAISQP